MTIMNNSRNLHSVFGNNFNHFCRKRTWCSEMEVLVINIYILFFNFCGYYKHLQTARNIDLIRDSFAITRSSSTKFLIFKVSRNLISNLFFLVAVSVFFFFLRKCEISKASVHWTALRVNQDFSNLIWALCKIYIKLEFSTEGIIHFSFKRWNRPWKSLVFFLCK